MPDIGERPASAASFTIGSARAVGWVAVRIARQPPRQWTVVTRDLWKDFGEFTLTGIAPTAMGGAALFDRIELLRSLDDVKPSQ